MKGNDYFNKIFNYLERKSGKDLLRNNVINLTASSYYSSYKIQNILEYDNNFHWFTEYNPPESH